MQTLISKNFEINKSQDISYEIFKNIKNHLTIEENIKCFIPQNSKNKLEIIKFIKVLKKNHIILETTKTKEKKITLKKYKYKKPKISIYNDMKKILISDPIHDIPEKHSWPKKTK